MFESNLEELLKVFTGKGDSTAGDGKLAINGCMGIAATNCGGSMKVAI